MAIRVPTNKEKEHHLLQLSPWSLAYGAFLQKQAEKARFFPSTIRFQTLVSMPYSGNRAVGVRDREGGK